ncbi:MAG TPA: NAD(P)-dependent oxidoreductase [Polyangiaceae bacterium]|nr:NAD(P)-dependent oxidoreductase [Polyangiaceae bacterium]
MKVLVTGAAGKLGSVVCKTLHDKGFDVRATDRRFRADIPVPLELADLTDELVAYRLLQGCEALVHLGNYPSMHSGPTLPTVLADNVRMNTNYFCAAVDLGLPRLVFASSVQVMLPFQWPRPAQHSIAYLPLDGDAPRNPGYNPYALSKESAERLLEVIAASHPKVACTALRFPGLRDTDDLERAKRWKNGFPRRWANFGEGLSHLFLDDAAELVACVLQNQKPGYHQYFPAVSPDFSNGTLADLVREEYGDVPLRKPLAELSSLIDIEAITRALGWKPTRRMNLNLAPSEPDDKD